ncbi:MAG TPA: L-aspartate oxidase [Candidatus Acidoferrales bacterium]|nr:L-aspartate oxidase [Candidatus Acidoferrales bacterium]
MTTHTTDVLIIGSGAAGLSLALRLAPHCEVTVVCKASSHESSTTYAQGGISAVLDVEDSVEAHVEDTLIAGAGLCDPAAVRFTAERGASAIAWLSTLGVAFTRTDSTGTLHLTREGGHRHRRIVHAADATGKAVSDVLLASCRAHPRIRLLERHMAVDLITGAGTLRGERACCGALLLNRDTGVVDAWHARSTALATGGASRAYLYTSNPEVATGDGIAMAWRAGCRVANLEFMQFHPTCLYLPAQGSRVFLISEAVRGEGGRLLLPDGTAFMDGFDPRGDLAPRDIVARAIDHEMKRLGIPCVYLDIRHRGAAFIRTHFPTIYAQCLALGLDMTEQPLPVVPAAHYTCGGVVTDLRARTDLKNLYAIGETAHTGLHGANRMASNSLLECFVFAEAAADDIRARLPQLSMADVQEDEPPPPSARSSTENVTVHHNWMELRRAMWDYVGIVRSDERLQRAQRRIALIRSETEAQWQRQRSDPDLLELRNLATVAELIVRSALGRRESRGLHYSLDHPETDPNARDTILVPDTLALPLQAMRWED